MKKRIICMLLVLTVVLSCVMGINTGNEVYAAVTNEDIGLLTYLGITDGEMTESAVMTRAEFVSMVIRAMDETWDFDNAPRTFNDVTVSHKYHNEIGYAKERGYITGDGSGKFYPDDYITFEEAMAVSLRAAGYGEVAAKMGYLSVARATGISDGLALGASDAMSGLDAAKMVYNLLNAPCPNNTYSYDGIETMMGDESFLHRVWGINVDTGVLESVGYMTVYDTFSEDTSVIIDGRTYVPSGIVIDESWFGQTLKIYYYTENDENYIYYAYPKNNEIIEFTGDDFDNYQNQTVTYYNENGKSVSAKIGIETTLLYNMKKTTAKALNTYLSVSGADIRMIDNNADRVFDIISIMEPEIYSGGFLDKAEMVLAGENQPHVDFGEHVMYGFYKASGQKLPLSEAEGEFCYSVYSPGDVNYPVLIIYNDITVEGTVEKKGANNKTVTIESGESYPVSGKSKITFDEIQIGKTYTFSIDNGGRIVDAGAKGTGGYEAVYIVGAKKESMGDVTVKIMDETGEMLSCSFADKLKVRGTDGNTNTLSASETLDALNSETNKAYGKFVFVKFNQNKEIREIIQLTEDTTKDYHVQEFQRNTATAQKRRWMRTTLSLQNQIQLKTSTKVFSVPYSELPKQEDKYYSVSGVDIFAHEDSYPFYEVSPKVEGQLVGTPVVVKAGELAADYFLVECPEGQGFEAATTRYGTIVNFYNKYDEDAGETKSVIKMLDHNGAELEIEYMGDPSYIEIGDVVQVNAVKEIREDNILIYYDRDKDKINYFSFYDPGTGVNEIGWRYFGFRLVRGKVLKIFGNTALFELSQNSEASIAKEYVDITNGKILTFKPESDLGYETKSPKYLKEGEEFFGLLSGGKLLFVLDFSNLK